MTIYYVNGISYEVPNPSEYGRGEEYSPPTISPDLPVLDASAYVSSVVPISARSGFLMARLFENSNVVALDFGNDAQMSETLDRISYFVERNQKKKVPTQVEIEEKITHLPSKSVWSGPQGLGEGHDLKMKDIADFYNQSAKSGIALTPGEKALLDRLLENKFLVRGPNGNYRATFKKVLIGMSRDSNVGDRRETFVHEYSHALFFLDFEFNKEIAKVWNSLQPVERRFLRGAMMASGVYASGDIALLQTEAQAHAIAPPFSEDGFVNILASANENCKARGKSSLACNDFWSYQGRIKDLLKTVHDRFIAISECRIPLLANWKAEGTMIFQGEAGFDCAKETEISEGLNGTELWRPIQPVSFQNPFDPIQSVLDEIQGNLNSHHAKK